MKRSWLAAIALGGWALCAQPPLTWTTAEDHADMLRQLGIQSLRPGPSGNEKAPNHANIDESKANPFPDWPDPLLLKNGKRVKNAKQWNQQRRPEIVEDFEREVLGRVPKVVPKVEWKVTQTADSLVGGRAVVAKLLTGHVDNSAYPAINVDIQMTLVTPKDVRGPVPVMIMFGRGGMPGTTPPMPIAFTGGDPPATEQLIAGGWGYASLNPVSVQADNGAGLTRGIIGLVNKGQARKPEDWGALRAWAWGASRALDYLQTDPAVDSKKVGIEGVSRYGKAALITMAFDQRFAVVLVGSSGEGGAKPHRRNFGEAVENLTGSGEYHWMAGNFLKYGAETSSFGRKDARDIPVDSHELIALCAPRATFISYGIPEKGDARWLDQQGSYMATVAAGPVFRLLGAKDLGVGDDYRNAKMPAVNVSQLDGRLAWRQHDGGHTDGPNWRYFIPWADRELGHTPVAIPALPPVAAEVAAPRTEPNSRLAPKQLLQKLKQGKIDLYFLGDSITRRWGATDYPEFLAHWKQTFTGWNAADFGWGADRTQNILWRLENGELDGIRPKAIVLLAGTNNVPDNIAGGDDAKAAAIVRGVTAIIRLARQKVPQAVVIVTAIFPRNDNLAYLPIIERVNAQLEKLIDGDRVKFLNVNSKLADAEGRLFEGMMVDKLHPSLKGYQVWADGLTPLLTQILGPRAAEDQAPPPTGDPSATR